LYTSDSVPALSATALEILAQNYVTTMAIVSRMGKRYDEKFINNLVYMPLMTDEDVHNKSKLESWLIDFEILLNVGSSLSEIYQLTYVEASDLHPESISIDKKTHGISNEIYFPVEQFKSVDYKRLTDLGEQLNGLIESTAFIKRGEKQKQINSFGEALDWLMVEAKRGQHVQRYKGLGEMNPDQLWETTMDPECRTLLQVKIEDVVGADEVFTTLMGDQVEPRREFIERNALTVENLDV